MPRSIAAVRTPSTDAKNRPVRSTRKDIDTRERKIGQDRTRVMKPTGNARESLEPTLVEPVERVVTKEKLEALRFLEEELTIIVHDTTNPTDEPIVEVYNGGTVQRFLRGCQQKVKRKYVEVLARAKKTGYSNKKVIDPQGLETYAYPAHHALKYPFSVIHDPSGDKGRAWLESILQHG